MRIRQYLKYLKLKQLPQRISYYLKSNPFLSPIIWSILLIGFIFFLFVWVPYKQIERKILLLKVNITQTRDGFQELKSLLNVLTQKPYSLNQAGIAYRLRTQTEASDRIIKMLGEINGVLQTEEKELNQNFNALIFYPNFSKNIKKEINTELSVDKGKLKDLESAIKGHFAVNQALLNLMVFDPDAYFDKPLRLYEEKELAQKLNSLNESIGKTEVALSELNPENDKRIKPVLEWIRKQHQKVIDIISAASQGDFQKAEIIKERFASNLKSIQRIIPQSPTLLINEIEEENLKILDDLLKTQENLLKNINTVQNKYFSIQNSKF